MDFGKIIAFMKEAERFKACERTCRTTLPGRPESDAEHTWHLALLLLLLENEWAGLDFPRMLKMALIHDLPELTTGDSNPYVDDTAGKEERELLAAEELFGRLPGGVGEGLMALFREYIAQESPESRAVKAADKLLPLIQNLCTNGDYSSYRSVGVEYGKVREYMDGFFREGGALGEMYRLLLEECRAEGVFAGSK